MRKYPEEHWKALGKLIHDERLKKGLSRMDVFARAVGRSTRTLQGLERGEPVSESTLECVADVLEIPVHIFYVALADPGHEFVAGGRGEVPNLMLATDDELVYEIARRFNQSRTEASRLQIEKLSLEEQLETLRGVAQISDEAAPEQPTASFDPSGYTLAARRGRSQGKQLRSDSEDYNQDPGGMEPA